MESWGYINIGLSEFVRKKGVCIMVVSLKRRLVSAYRSFVKYLSIPRRAAQGLITDTAANTGY